MRFFADGPDVPDELLVARDEGQVVFFCGAGVSKAKANRPLFFELAEAVIQSLGVTANSPALKLLQQAHKLEEEGFPGLVAADRVFGLLEREFNARDIEAAVASTLAPKEGVTDLSAHETLIDLATTQTGQLKLVTTNFDLLFEATNESLPSFHPPKLPDPGRPDELNGIVHLHGRVNSTHSGSAGEGFVLSSSEFGTAYLAEAWATNFIREILKRSRVVFVGYSADDPPILYLLEALNRHSRGEIYAFELGEDADARAKWEHKGVSALAYQSVDGHESLWRSLRAWADRARDPDTWVSQTINIAKRGPTGLNPHERGQVMSLLSTVDGARRFAVEKPPAEWLCVMDPVVRYGAPAKLFNEEGAEQYTDPFKSYCLDGDWVPPQPKPEDLVPKRDIPANAFRAFAPNWIDRAFYADREIDGFTGYRSTKPVDLSPRLFQLARWIGEVSNQPAAVWWSAGTNELHETIRDSIVRHQSSENATGSAPIREAWQYIFEGRPRNYNPRSDWYSLKQEISRAGWSSYVVRRMADIFPPYFEFKRPRSASPPADDSPESLRRHEMVEISIEYPNQHEDPDPPDEWLKDVVVCFRFLLVRARDLERQNGTYALQHLSPIDEDENHRGEPSRRDRGISKMFLYYVGLFKRLLDLNPDVAKREFRTWPLDDEYVFARLRIWAAREEGLLSSAEAAEVIGSLSNEVFWDSYHARDLLRTLAARWGELDAEQKQLIEGRLLRGRDRWEHEDHSEYEPHRAHSILNRIHWLNNNNCDFTFDIGEQTKMLQEQAPRWKPEYASGAADSMEGRGGWVRSDTRHDDLVGGPLATVLERAEALSGHDHEHFVEIDPFKGLVESRPVRAFLALRIAMKRGDHPVWAWSKFLYSEARKADAPRLSCVAAYRLAELPDPILKELVRPITSWLRDCAPILFGQDRRSFDSIWRRIVEVLKTEPSIGHSGVQRGDDRDDWATDALTAPAGHLMQALISDPQVKDLQEQTRLPSSWLDKVNELLRLPSELRCQALVFIGHRLDWFHYFEEQWTDTNAISVLGSGTHAEKAIWAGFFWRSQIPPIPLFRKLKKHLLALAAAHAIHKQHYVSSLVAMLLAGWGTVVSAKERLVTNEEMRAMLVNADDSTRSSALWQLKQWSGNSTDEDTRWHDSLIEFLENVWPRQRQASSAETTGHLVDIAFAEKDLFPAIVQIVLPLLTVIDRNTLVFYSLRDEDTGAVELYPSKALSVLRQILSDDATGWPYRSDKFLDRVVKAAPELANDERYLELKAIWDNR